MKKILTAVALLMTFAFAFAQINGAAQMSKKALLQTEKQQFYANNQPKGVQTVSIQTNALSEKSNEVFEGKLPFLKGIKSFTFDVQSSKISVTFDPRKTNIDTIRKEISNLGFNADNVAANETARAKLPSECKVKACAKSCCGHKH